jgi:hypothetical protein
LVLSRLKRPKFLIRHPRAPFIRSSIIDSGLRTHLIRHHHAPDPLGKATNFSCARTSFATTTHR